MNRITHPIEPEELMAYLDGELAVDRVAGMSAHVNECAECKALADELRGVSRSAAKWKIESVDSPIPTVIESALADRKLTRHYPRRGAARTLFSRRWFKPALVGAFALLVLGVMGLPGLFREQSMDLAVPPSASTDQDRARGFTAGSNRDHTAGLTHPGQNRSELGAKLEGGNDEASAQLETKSRAALPAPSPASAPMIIRTAQLAVTTTEFDKARGALEAILKRHHGYMADLKTGSTTGSGRTLSATLRVPADQLDPTISELKSLGRVESESQSGQDITSQYVDLEARLENARNTSKRLADLLQNRTGKLSDVLEVEQELDRVRGEIEQMEAERKNMSNQVSFATLNATITEDYKAQLQVVPPSTSTRLSNAAVEGYRAVVETILGLALFLLSSGPTLLLWGAIFFIPARLIWKRVRRDAAQ